MGGFLSKKMKRTPSKIEMEIEKKRKKQLGDVIRKTTDMLDDYALEDAQRSQPSLDSNSRHNTLGNLGNSVESLGNTSPPGNSVKKKPTMKEELLPLSRRDTSASPSGSSNALNPLSNRSLTSGGGGEDGAEIMQKASTRSLGTNIVNAIDKLTKSMIGRRKGNAFQTEDGKIQFAKNNAKEVFMQALESSELFKETTHEFRESLFREAIPIFVVKNDMLYTEGTYGHLLFVSISATLQIVSNQSSTTMKLSKGSLLGENSMIANVPHRESCRVIKNGLMLSIHRLQYQLLVSRQMSSSAAYADNFIDNIAFFAPLSLEQKKKLAAAFSEERTFVAGSQIIGPDSRAPGLYFVVKGEVCARVQSSRDHADREDDEDDGVEWFERGGCFGEGSLLSGAAQLGLKVVAGAEQSVTLRVLTKEAFLRVLREDGGDAQPTIDMLNHFYAVRLMNRLPIFSMLSESQIEHLASFIEHRSYKPTQMVYNETQDAGAVYVVLHGAVKMYRKRKPQAEARGGRSNLREAAKLESTRNLLEAAGDGKSKANKALSVLGVNPAFLERADEFLLKNLLDEDYVVFTHGEVLGEESLESNKRYAGSVYALGGVVCLVLPVKDLRELGLFSLVAQAVNEENKPMLTSEIITTTQLQKTAERIASLKGAADVQREMSECSRLSLQFLDFSKVQKSLSQATLVKVKELHHTALVDVFVATHNPSMQIVVVKQSDLNACNECGNGQYVLSERAVLASLSSNFVANMLTAWEDVHKGSMTLCLEPSLAGDLEDMLQHTMRESPTAPRRGELGGIDYEELRFIAGCVLLGLKHLFEHNVIHRDVKPANCIMDHRGVVKLTDFGLSKKMNYSTARTNTPIGSPKYMAGELAAFFYSASPYSYAVDWWAFGVSLYQLALGTMTPFEGKLAEWGGNSKKQDMVIRRVLDFNNANLALLRAGVASDELVRQISQHAIFSPFRGGKNEVERDALVGFIARMLAPTPEIRVGAGPRAVMKHQYFSSVNWEDMSNRRTRPPFVPTQYIIDLKHLGSGEAREEVKEARKKKPELTRGNVIVGLDSLETSVKWKMENIMAGAFSEKSLLESESKKLKTMNNNKQLLKRMMFKMDNELGDQINTNKIQVLSRITELEAMQYLYDKTGRRGYLQLKDKDLLVKSAVKIQRAYRRRHPPSRKATIQLKATIKIQRNFRKHKANKLLQQQVSKKAT